MENTTNYEQEIDLKALLFAVIHKYRQILAAAVAGAVLLGAVGAFRYASSQKALEKAVADGEEIPRTEAEQKYEEEMVKYRAARTKHDTAVLEYTQELRQNEADQTRAEYSIENTQEYIDRSVLNSLDAYELNVANAVFYITTDYKILPGMDYQNPDYTSAVLSAYTSLLTNSEAIENIAQQFDMEARYMRELIDVSADNKTRLLTISTKGKDAQQADDIMEAVLKRFSQLYDTIEERIGTHQTTQISRSDITTVSTSLRDAQQANRDNLEQLQNNLKDLKSEHDLLEQNIETADQDFAAVEEPTAPVQGSSAVKYAVIGGLIGIVAVAGVVVLRFLMEDRVYSAEELQSSCDIQVLGTLTGEKTRKAKGVDAWLNKLEKRPDGSTDAEITNLIAVTIRSCIPQAEKLLVTGDLPAQELEALKDALQASDALRNVEIFAGESITKCSATVQKAMQADAVILAADCGCSQYGTVRAQKEKLNGIGKKIFGCVLYA